MNEVQIILLNGPTCSGKTSISQIIQNKLETPYLLLQLDTFVNMLPARYTSQSYLADRSVRFTQMRHVFHKTIANLTTNGSKVIVDTVQGEASWLDEWINNFGSFKVMFVGVFAQSSDLIAREAKRSRHDDIPGTAELQFHTVHLNNVYDVRLDTSSRSIEDCADEVIEFVLRGSQPWAFDELKQRRSKIYPCV